jgi:hypothetical protein
MVFAGPWETNPQITADTDETRASTLMMLNACQGGSAHFRFVLSLLCLLTVVFFARFLASILLCVLPILSSDRD